MKTETKRTVAAKLMLFSSAVIWGSSFFILKNTLDELPVYFLLCVRFLFSAILLSIVFLKNGNCLIRNTFGQVRLPERFWALRTYSKQ